MAIVCSRCSHIHDEVGACPRCGAANPSQPVEHAPAPTHGPRWQQTAWGRILIGLILAQGLFYGLRYLVTGILLAYSGLPPEALWEDVGHLLILQGLQIFGLVLGAVVAGGGQRSGMVLGAVIGAWNGVLGVTLRQNPAQELTFVGLYGQPMLQAAIGAVGGWLGSLIWKPISSSAVPTVLIPLRKKARRKRPPIFAGRVYWLRVLAGSAFAVAGTLSAALIFQKVMDFTGGNYGGTSVMQDRIITWEIKALVLLVGAALAGATTPNGLKQGLYVGLTSCVVLIGIHAPMTEAWVEYAFWTIIGTFSLSLVGGWFGGQLFPPVVKLDRRRGLGAYT
jgi:hypothetical protein